jgi:hypothetical protein
MRSPHWRALLEARWHARLHEITELSLACHAAGAPDGDGAASQREMERLLRRTVVARRNQQADQAGTTAAAHER